MNFNKLIDNGVLERLVTDILYADLEAGKVDFFKVAYKKLKISRKQIMKVGKRISTISSKAVNAVYEIVIDIIVEALCQKRNEGLYKEFMDYNLKRFPDVKKEFDIFWNHIEQWSRLYADTNKKIEQLFVKRSFSTLYCLTYGKSDAVDDFCENQVIEYNNYYGNGRYNFHDQKKTAVKHDKWLDKTFPVINFRKTQLFKGFVKTQIGVMSDYYFENPDTFGEFFVLLATHIIPGIYNIRRRVSLAEMEDVFADELNIFEAMNNILGKYNMNQATLFYAREEVYIDMFTEIFEQMCMEEIDRRWYSCDSEEESMDIMIKICEEEIDPASFVREAMIRFWYECHLMDQRKLYDEYYKTFSFDDSEIDMKAVQKENDSLKDELGQCRKKLQQYEQADSERRKQQNQEAKKQDRLYSEKIASLEKRLKEQEEALEKQAKTVEDMKEYIDLVESAEKEEMNVDSMDVTKIYDHKILFVGGRQETVTRLKAVFTTADFIVNETATMPKKIELIVLMAAHMNHELSYKYIGFAREKGIKVIYCNETNIDTIINKVACSL